ncbi:MAG: hypothetical protein ACREOO_16105 [bacterium]
MMRHRHHIWRALTWSFLAFLLSGCREKLSFSGPIFFEFKQQPGDKYVYKVFDEVVWTFRDSTGKIYDTVQHAQEQKSIMKFTSIDSNAVRNIDLVFIITRDTTLKVAESSWWKKRKSPVGNKYEFELGMQPNGGIVSVTSARPAQTLFYDTAYRPSQPVFPATAIPVGYSWSKNFNINVPKGEPGAVEAEYKFSALERVGEFDCAVIEFKSQVDYTEPFNPREKCSSVADCRGQYHSQTVSEGKLYFAYREGFMVKKVNLITANAEATLTQDGVVKTLSRTEQRDQETITLVAIYRSSGEKLTFEIK